MVHQLSKNKKNTKPTTTAKVGINIYSSDSMLARFFFGEVALLQRAAPQYPSVRRLWIFRYLKSKSKLNTEASLKRKKQLQ